MIRLFVGVSLPPTVRDRLCSLMTGVDDIRWLRDDQLHITLRFIGDVEEPVAAEIATGLEVVRATAFPIRMDGVGIFGLRRRTKILWAKVAPAAPIEGLHDRVAGALHRIGIEGDGRRFTPHVTLSRIKKRAPGLEHFLEANAAFATPPFEVAEFHLYSSHLSQSGALYRIEQSYPLETP